MMTSTTKRYKAFSTRDSLSKLQVQDDDLYQFGCEFEFYIDTSKCNFQDAVENVKNTITNFCNVDILVDLVSLPQDKDKNCCIQIKPDQSLKGHGVEISIPITTQDGVQHYIKNILPLIDKYGYTNEDTGLHFHISTTQQDGVNFNFYLYMLICHDKNLLSSWLPRSGYSHNVMDILSKNTKTKSREIKNKKGTIWNLERIDASHVEIKAIGGVDYHKETDKILTEFNKYVEYFDMVTKDSNPEYRQKVITEHKRLIQTIDQFTKKEFSKAVDEAGLV